jgi:hypothetical protein
VLGPPESRLLATVQNIVFRRDCLVRLSSGINHKMWNVCNLLIKGKILLALETAIGGRLGVVVGRTMELLNHIDVNL